MKLRSAISAAEEQDGPHANSLTETNVGLFPETLLAAYWNRNHFLGEPLLPQEVESAIPSYSSSAVEDFAFQGFWVQMDELPVGLMVSSSELTARWIFWDVAPDSTWIDFEGLNFRAHSVLAKSESTTFSEDDASSHLKELLLLQINTEELFVDGMDSSLAREVVSAIEAFGNAAVDAVRKIMDSGRTNVEIVGELLRQLGYMEDIWSHRARRDVLASKLESPDPRIRDAASVGISALDDPSLLESVTRAFGRETSILVKENLKLVMDQLQETKCQDF